MTRAAEIAKRGRTRPCRPRGPGRPPRVAGAVLVALGLLGAVPPRAPAFPPTAAEPTTARTPAAHVDRTTIYVDQVEQTLARLPQHAAAAADPETLRRQVLEQLINRQLVLAFLAERSYAASREDVELELRRFEARLAARQRRLADYLAQTALSGAELRAQLLWRLSWQRYLAVNVNDATLASYFQQHRRDWDGTRIRAAHVFWKVAEPLDHQAVAEATAQADAVRRRIVAGQLTFAEAAQQHSQAPTTEQGGQIGWIDRHEPMPEPFSRAAWQLEPGQISPPVITPFGVHLIRCEEIEPGTRQWQDVREPLARALADYLFHWLAERQRRGAVIEYTAAIPRPARGPARRPAER